MKPQRAISILFRKYPLVRIGSVVFIILAAIGVLSFVGIKTKRAPIIDSITPTVGTAGDVLTITGRDFGDARALESYVEVGGSRITASGYLSWSDREIRLVLPTNVQDGLVLVGTKSGVSKPAFFANEADIPVPVPIDTTTTLPAIATVMPTTASYGSLIVITGANFGTIRGGSKVYFAANRDDATSLSPATAQQPFPGDFAPAFIAADERNYDYEYWSDTEIHVRVPDGATDGALYVQTSKGDSNHSQLAVHSAVGTRNYSERKTYLLQVTADVENLDARNPATILFRVPRPPVTAQQPMAELTECVPSPLIADYRSMIIQQAEFEKGGARKQRFTQNFVVAVYSVNTAVNARAVKPFSERARVLYSDATRADALIRSDDARATQRAREVVQGAINPYTQARLLYEHITEAYELTTEPIRGRDDVLDMLKITRGDAYDFAVLFTTLARSLGIPALPVSGILVNADLKAINHWWSEIYIEDFGWLPVDPALGAGFTYKSFKPVDDAQAFYFGNLDSQHIAFSRGWNEVKPSFINSKTVYRPRTYAFQSIWEESASDTVNYSSLWNAPTVLGIY